MAFDTTDVLLSILKIAIILGLWLNVTPIMVWIERRGSALIQDRPGPNRVGPFGLFQSIADALKFILKEDIVPAQAHKWLYTLAPTFGLLPALTTVAVVPWGRGFTIPEMTLFGRKLFEGGRWFEPVVADVSAGVLVVFALASLSAYVKWLPALGKDAAPSKPSYVRLLAQNCSAAVCPAPSPVKASVRRLRLT